MTDPRLRALERVWKASGAEEDLAVYLRARLRSGTPSGRLHVAAICGLELPAGVVEPLLVPLPDAERLFARRPSTLKRWGGVVEVDGEARYDLVAVLRSRLRRRRRSFEDVPFLARAVAYLDPPSAAQALRIALEELLLGDWLRRAPQAEEPLRAVCSALAGFCGGEPPDVSRAASEAAGLLEGAPGVGLLRGLRDLRATLGEPRRVEAALREALSARVRALAQEAPDSRSVIEQSVQAQLVGALQRGLREWVLGCEAEEEEEVGDAAPEEQEPAADPVAAAWERWGAARGLGPADEDEVASLAGRVASGELPLARLEVAAVCGHGPAQRALERIEGRALLGTQDVARIYGVTASGVGGWTRTGCPVQRRGRQNQFDLTQVFAWLRARSFPVPRGLMECFLRTVRYLDGEAARRVEAALEEAGLGGCRHAYDGGPRALEVRREVHEVIRAAIVPWVLGYP